MSLKLFAYLPTILMAFVLLSCGSSKDAPIESSKTPNIEFTSNTDKTEKLSKVNIDVKSDEIKAMMEKHIGETYLKQNQSLDHEVLLKEKNRITALIKRIKPDYDISKITFDFKSSNVNKTIMLITIP